MCEQIEYIGDIIQSVGKGSKTNSILFLLSIFIIWFRPVFKWLYQFTVHYTHVTRYQEKRLLQLSMQGHCLTLGISLMSVFMGLKITMVLTLESWEQFVCGMLRSQEKLQWRSCYKKAIPSLVLPLVGQKRSLLLPLSFTSPLLIFISFLGDWTPPGSK